MADNNSQQQGGAVQVPDPMLAAVQARAQETAANPGWTPQESDPTHHIQIGDTHYRIHSDDLPEAQRRVPELIVHGQITSGDPMLDAVTARKNAKDASVPTAAAQPGAYQQTKEQAQAHVVHNVNEDAAKPFSDATTSLIGSTGALMKRPDETDSQFMARAIQAGRNVTQSQIDAENLSNKRLAAPTLGAAAAAGPAMLSLEAAAGSVFDFAAEKLGMSAAEDMGLKEWVEQMGQKMPTVLDKATGAAKVALRWMSANPIKTYLIYKTARELGLPLGKLLHLASSGE